MISKGRLPSTFFMEESLYAEREAESLSHRGDRFVENE